MKTRVPLSALSRWSPYDHQTWDITTPVSRAAVAKAIAQGNLLSPKEVYDPCRDEILPGRISARQFHVRRIAYLVVHGWRGAILLDVGVPAFGRQPDWIVEDGNHRHAAALFRGDTDILADICGDLDYARELLGLKSRRMGK